MSRNRADVFEEQSDIPQRGRLDHRSAKASRYDGFTNRFSISCRENCQTGNLLSSGPCLYLRIDLQYILRSSVGEKQHAVGWGCFELLQGVFGRWHNRDLKIVATKVFLQCLNPLFLSIDDQQAEVRPDLHLQCGLPLPMPCRFRRIPQ